MKNIKKIVAVLLSMTAIASTSVMAADEAKFESGTASLELKETVLSGEQLTVVIVPTTATEITSENIYYINQGAFGEEFNNILAAMKVKDGFGEAKDYEVRIGGVVEDDKYVVKTFNFAVEEDEIIIYGDANGDGSVLADDATRILQYRAGQEVEIDLVAADANGDESVLADDATRILQYRAGQDVTLGK